MARGRAPAGGAEPCRARRAAWPPLATAHPRPAPARSRRPDRPRPSLRFGRWLGGCRGQQRGLRRRLGRRRGLRLRPRASSRRGPRAAPAGPPRLRRAHAAWPTAARRRSGAVRAAAAVETARRAAERGARRGRAAQPPDGAGEGLRREAAGRLRPQRARSQREPRRSPRAGTARSTRGLRARRPATGVRRRAARGARRAALGSRRLSAGGRRLSSGWRRRDGSNLGSTARRRFVARARSRRGGKRRPRRAAEEACDARDEVEPRVGRGARSWRGRARLRLGRPRCGGRLGRVLEGRQGTTWRRRRGLHTLDPGRGGARVERGRLIERTVACGCREVEPRPARRFGGGVERWSAFVAARGFVCRRKLDARGWIGGRETLARRHRWRPVGGSRWTRLGSRSAREAARGVLLLIAPAGKPPEGA